jgi:hypothetical protein
MARELLQQRHAVAPRERCVDGLPGVAVGAGDAVVLRIDKGALEWAQGHLLVDVVWMWFGRVEDVVWMWFGCVEDVVCMSCGVDVVWMSDMVCAFAL